METALFVLAIIGILSGIAMSTMPGLPGPGVSLLGLCALYFAPSFVTVPLTTLIWFGATAIAISIINNFIPLAVLSSTGSSRYALYGGLIGLFLGMFLFPPFGPFVGLFLGACAGEMYVANDISRALHAGIGTIIGVVIAQLITVAFSLSVFVYALFVLPSPLL